jgi:hypothetical protein
MHKGSVKIMTDETTLKEVISRVAFVIGFSLLFKFLHEKRKMRILFLRFKLEERVGECKPALLKIGVEGSSKLHPYFLILVSDKNG